MNSVLVCISLLVLCTGCIDTNKKNESAIDSVATKKESTLHALPFVGKKYFETRPRASGNATPHRSVQIYSDGIVEFSIASQNIFDGKIDKEVFKAGYFKEVMKCEFSKEWEDEDRYYVIKSDRIYEADSIGNIIRLEDCCSLTVLEDACSCESDYDDNQTW